MSISRIVLIYGRCEGDLDAATKVMAYFLRLNCQIQSSQLIHSRGGRDADPMFLYTLVHPQGFSGDGKEHLKQLEGIEYVDSLQISIA